MKDRDEAAALVDGPCREAMDAIMWAKHTAGSIESRADLLREVTAAIRAAEQRGREAGARDMRERAQGVAITRANFWLNEPHRNDPRADTCMTLAGLIVALPLAPSAEEQ